MSWELKYIKKLMGWCPTKNSLQNEMKEGCFSNFKLENRNIQLSSSPVDLQEGRTLKVQVSLFDWWWLSRALIIIFFTLIASSLLWIYIRIKKPMRKPIVIEKEDIMQISMATKNYNHSLRWLARLFCIILIPVYFIEGIPNNLQHIEHIEGLFSNYIDFNLFLGHLATVTMLLVLFYNGELLASYQQALKVTTHSKLELTFFTNKPEELTSFLKNERDKK